MWNPKREFIDDENHNKKLVFDYYCRHCQNEFIIKTKYFDKVNYCPVCNKTLERIQ